MLVFVVVEQLTTLGVTSVGLGVGVVVGVLFCVVVSDEVDVFDLNCCIAAVIESVIEVLIVDVNFIIVVCIVLMVSETVLRPLLIDVTFDLI